MAACELNFGLKPADLFDANELYDVSDFGKVINFQQGLQNHLISCYGVVRIPFVALFTFRIVSVTKGFAV